MKPQKIDFRLWAQLQTGLVARVWFERASLQIENNQFVMRGPSGTQALDVYATDDARLDAHWQAFASAPANRYA